MMNRIFEERDLVKGLPPAGSKVLVAVSGGPDSMAVLHLLLNKSYNKWNYDVYAAHVHHGLREETADEDERFVREWCERHDVPYFSTKLYLNEVLRTQGGNVQEEARRKRYEYLRQLMNDYNISYLATGHHADDQLETVLMKQVTGRAALGDLGIAYSRPFHPGTLIRPLLSITKDQIITYCREYGLAYQVDESNSSDKYTRNRFRHHVLPFLKEENPVVHRHVQQFVEWASDERRYIEQQTESEIQKIIEERHEFFVTTRISGLLSLPLPLQRRGIPLILSYLCEDKVSELSVLHIDQLIERIHQTNPSFTLDWPGGVKVSRSYDILRFSVGDEILPIRKSNSVHLPLPGQVSFYNFCMKAERKCTEEESTGTLLCREDDIALPLIVRSVNHGDRMQPYGMDGRKKVSRIFIDEKIPRRERERWPVITDAKGTILWVPMIRKSIHHIRDPQAGERYITVSCNKSNKKL